MNLDRYLSVVSSYIINNFNNVCNCIPELGLKNVGGLVLTHVFPVSMIDEDEVLIKRGSFHSFEDLKDVCEKEGLYANDIYINPIAVMNSTLILQFNVDSWCCLSDIDENMPFIRSHGLSIKNYFSEDEVEYDSLPSCKIIDDNYRMVVDPLNMEEKSNEVRKGLAKRALKQILEEYEVTQEFESALHKCIMVEDNLEVLEFLLEILGKVKIDQGGDILVKYLKNDALKLVSFISATKSYFYELKEILKECYKAESDEMTRFLMLKNLAGKGRLSSEEVLEMVSDINLSKRESRFLEKKIL